MSFPGKRDGNPNTPDGVAFVIRNEPLSYIDELKTNFTVHYTDLKQIIEDELEKFISLSVEENYYTETEYSKKLTELFPEYNNTVMCIAPIGSE